MSIYVSMCRKISDVVMLLCAFGISIQLEAQCFTVTETVKSPATETDTPTSATGVQP